MNRHFEAYYESLQTRDFFSRLTLQQMNRLKTQSVIHQYRKGQILYFQTELKQYVYFLLKGLIRIEKSDQLAEHTYYDYIKEDTFFPYGDLFSQRRHDHTAIALTEIDLLLIPHEVFCDIVVENKDQLLYMYTQVSNILSFQELRLQLTTISNAMDRVTHSLALWMMDMGKQYDSIVEIPYPLTIMELAEVSGTTRETAGKVVKDLSNEHKLEFTRKKIIFYDSEYFQNLLN